jgi:surface protein
MFNACSSLAELDLSSFDTRNVTDMGSMFNGCSSLTELDLSNFDTSNVTNMQAMFQSCNKLETLNMSGWDFSKAMTSDYYYNSPFQNNSGIKRLNLTNAKF